MTNTLDITTLHLASGGHDSPEDGLCFNEAVAYFAGEPHSARPKCCSPVITAFTMRLNDRLDDENRQRLTPYLLKVVGTNTGRQEDENTRKLMLSEWLLHEALPGLYRTAGLTEHAEAIEQLAGWTDYDGYMKVRPTLVAARDAAWAKRTALWKRIRSADDAAAADAAVADGVAVAAVAVAAAAVAAAGVADAAAVAVAAVADAAVAAAAAAADGAVADAAAVAAAAADDVAVASLFKAALSAAKKAKAGGGDYWKQRRAAYDVFYPAYKVHFAEINNGLLMSALLLLDRLIDVGKVDG